VLPNRVLEWRRIRFVDGLSDKSRTLSPNVGDSRSKQQNNRSSVSLAAPTKSDLGLAQASFPAWPPGLCIQGAESGGLH